MKKNILLQLKFSPWCAWSERDNLRDVKSPGVYILAKLNHSSQKCHDLESSQIIYVGETCSSIKGRLRKFNRAAFKGCGGHSGGISYRKKFNDDGLNLFVSILPIPSMTPDIKNLIIRYKERELILNFALKNGKAPVLNKK